MIAELQDAISNGAGKTLRDQRVSDADRMKMKVERHALLLRGAPIAIAVSAVNAVIALMVAWGQVDPVWLGGWFSAVIILSMVRLIIWRRFSKNPAGAHGLIRFTSVHVAAMGANGVLWGAFAPLLAVSGMLSNAFLPFILAGMTAAAISSASASWKAVVAFNVPVLFSTALAYAFFAPSDGLAIAGIITIYGLATAVLAWRAQQIIERSIRLRSRHDLLLKTLTRQVSTAHESDQRYRALVETSGDVTLIFTPQGKITFASSAAEDLLGMPPPTILGRTTRDLVHPRDLDMFRAAGNKVLARLGSVTPVGHVCLKGADGYVALTGRLTNMLYVPGVEGFVFTGGLVREGACVPVHAV